MKEDGEDFDWRKTKRVSLKAAGNGIVVGIVMNFDWSEAE